MEDSVHAKSTINQLVTIFGFPLEKSIQAVNSIQNKKDVQLACEWLLDHGEEDKGGPVSAIECKHLTEKVEKKLKKIEELEYGGSCVDCGNVGENWVCLFCGEVRCSRYCYGHGLKHWEEEKKKEEERKKNDEEEEEGEGHFLALSLMDLSIWCYECKAYVTNSALKERAAHMSKLKFGEDSKEEKKEKKEKEEKKEEEIEELPRNFEEEIDRVVKFLEEGCEVSFGKVVARVVIILSGAGISVSCGIPDFRSKGGMYDTLRPELLTASMGQRAEMALNPTFVVDWKLFKENSLPYLELRRNFIMDACSNKWKPSKAHWFERLLHDKGLLKRIYTTNVDGIDHQIGLPENKVIQCHGSYSRVECCGCGAGCPPEEFREEVRRKIKDIYGTDEDAPKESEMVLCKECGEPLVKPTTVLYNSPLPKRFWEGIESDFCEENKKRLLLVMGTSLTVAPANTLPSYCDNTDMKVLINMTKTGQNIGFGKKENDVFLLGGCDEVVGKLAEKMGWEEELMELVGGN